MFGKDPVYQILKLLQEDKEVSFQDVGLDEKDFNMALRHIHEAGYATVTGLHSSGLDYIKGYERRLI